MLKEVSAGREELWGSLRQNSFLGNIVLAITDNSTIINQHKTYPEVSRYLSRVERPMRQFHRTKRSSVSDLHDSDTDIDEASTTVESMGYTEHDHQNTVVNGEPFTTNSGYEVYHVKDQNENFEKENEKQTKNANIPTHPSARYGHAACR